MTKVEGLEAFRTYCDMAETWMGLEAFPEGIMGAESVRKTVREHVESGYSFAYLTRYETIINTLGVLIYEGKIKPDQVKIFLIEPETTIACHQFDNEGCLLAPWPFGILA